MFCTPAKFRTVHSSPVHIFPGLSSVSESSNIRSEAEYSDIIFSWFPSSFQPKARTISLLQVRLQTFPATLFAVHYSLAQLIL